ncbi:MAG: MogA/MoaB family molybdenum cofactor biosynthesis protein [Lachnospiraceae bacterium]|nr:MogA/MoaB family molybdenum cofactor biosynthesis protein [Lachnospiraceae bacterium]
MEEKKYSAAVITISTKGAKGERVDTSGPNLVKMLELDGYDVKYVNIIPDDRELIKKELLKASDEGINLILTTGGTGFSESDITPEATKDVVERLTPGIPEMMRVLNYKNTDKSCLSRSVAGIRKKSLIINLPGSKNAAKENFEVVMKPIKHGLEVLMTSGSTNCGG